MSVKNVKAFFKEVEEDKALQGKLKVVAENRNTEEALADLVKIAAEAGFEFTSIDYTECRKQVAEELSEAELKAVTAGVPGCPFGYKCGLLIRF